MMRSRVEMKGLVRGKSEGKEKREREREDMHGVI